MGSLRLAAVLSDSQNSPSLVVPSPVVTSTTSSLLNPSVIPSSCARSEASAAPTAWRNCVPVGDDTETMLSVLLAPVAGHLAAAGVGIGGGADGRFQHLRGGEPQFEAERAVAVIEEEPVVGRLEHHAGGREHRLVSGARDLEEDLVLALELDLLVVDAARQEHGLVCGKQLVAGQVRRAAAFGFAGSSHDRIRSRADDASRGRARRHESTR